MTARAETTIQADGRELRLVFGWNEAATFEEVSGKALSDVLSDVAKQRLSAKTLRGFLYAGLREHHADVDLAGAGQLLDVVGRVEANRVLGVALRAYFPELGDDPDAAASPAKGA